ncbi:MAG: SAP domain-containing protein [Candidatus Omnitrophota bacterium]|jgi:hypothetical protein
MKLTEVQRKARKLGIKDTWKYTKKQLIKEIQRREGNFDCFGTAYKECDQDICCWKEDCLK